MDQFVFKIINQFVGKFVWLDTLAIFFAKYFEYVLIFSVIVIFRKKWKIIFQAFLAAVLARFGIIELIRFLWYRPRPFIESNINLLLPHDSTGSFPSGHAAFYFAIAAVVYFYDKKLGTLFFIASFLIGVARVFSGVHWPSDIAAGALVGIFSAWLTSRITKKGA